jgi:phosphoribosylformylglycinamidine synthase
MKNDAFSGDSKISIRPTLLISLMGIIPDIRRAITTDFKQPGNIIFVLGETRAEYGGSILEKITGRKLGACPRVIPDAALPLYRVVFRAVKEGLIQSCHDLADGGLAVSLVESALGGRLGCTVSLSDMAGTLKKNIDPLLLLFSETPSRFIVSVKPEDVCSFRSLLSGFSFAELGKVESHDSIVIKHLGNELLSLGLDKALAAWKGML